MRTLCLFLTPAERKCSRLCRADDSFKYDTGLFVQGLLKVASHQLFLIIQYTVVRIRIWLLFCFVCWFDVALVCCSDLISFSYQGRNSIRLSLYTAWDSSALKHTTSVTMQRKTWRSYIFGHNCDRHNFRLWKNIFKKKPLLKYFIYNWNGSASL